MTLLLQGVIADGVDVDVAAGVEVATKNLVACESDSVDLKFSRSSLLSISHRLFSPAFHLSNTLLRFHAIIQSQMSILACCNQAGHGDGGC
jgi:hypothetical protein